MAYQWNGLILRKVICLLGWVCTMQLTDAQPTDPATSARQTDIQDFMAKLFGKSKADTMAQKPKSSMINILPAFSHNPSNGWQLGISANIASFLGPQPATSISNAMANASFTTKKQFHSFVKTNVFLNTDDWNLVGDWRFQISSQPTFGLGTGPGTATLADNGAAFQDKGFASGLPEGQMMRYSQFRVYETVSKRIKQRLFGGIGFHFDYFFNIKDQLLNLTNDPLVITSHYAYSLANGFNPKGYTTTGISLNLLLDSRDNSINPYRGHYANASFRFNPAFASSGKNSTTLWLEYRTYVNVSRRHPRHLLAFWTYGSFLTDGKLPYMSLAALGWDPYSTSGRGYPQGRFQGEQLMYGEVEYRFPISRRNGLFGGVLFLNAVTATDEAAGQNLFQAVNVAGGIGLRAMFNKVSRANVQADYGVGAYGSQGFYMGLREVF